MLWRPFLVVIPSSECGKTTQIIPLYHLRRLGTPLSYLGKWRRTCTPEPCLPSMRRLDALQRIYRGSDAPAHRTRTLRTRLRKPATLARACHQPITTAAARAQHAARPRAHAPIPTSWIRRRAHRHNIRQLSTVGRRCKPPSRPSHEALTIHGVSQQPLLRGNDTLHEERAVAR
jgi:hypothetical protein